MKSKLSLFNATTGVVIKTLDWEDKVETHNGMKRVKDLSVFDDLPIFDGIKYRITHMLSAENL